LDFALFTFIYFIYFVALFYNFALPPSPSRRETVVTEIEVAIRYKSKERKTVTYQQQIVPVPAALPTAEVSERRTRLVTHHAARQGCLPLPRPAQHYETAAETRVQQAPPTTVRFPNSFMDVYRKPVIDNRTPMPGDRAPAVSYQY